MYDIEKWEKEWAIYHKKRRRPLYIVLIFSIVLVSSAVTIYLNDALNHQLKPVRNNISDIQVTADRGTLPKEAPDTSIEKEPEEPAAITETPKMVIEAEPNPYDAASREPVTITEMPKMVIETEPNPYDTASKEPVLENVESLSQTEVSDSVSKKEETNDKKIHLDILETSSVTAFKDVESRFYRTHDTDDSLFLAKSYFNRGEYKKTEYWALQTNKVDDSLEESWLLFAQAKAKQGQKHDAIKVLRSYIERSNSIEAKRLLEQIK